MESKTREFSPKNIMKGSQSLYYGSPLSIRISRLKAIQKLPIGAMKGRKFPNCRLCSQLSEDGCCKCSAGCVLLLNN
ncbi:hypothetical protein NEF87_000870 [Candidatus Lokiarchaeum ossiferum]|uniref:Uncharacterized protein n=1 Tax=Candidatus Lokiarchaeum ossiferum TaxID=2951803 RepID=A0ABY6HMH4_9ARCH|nr:hypothetical protein NEF87_000870 [Candidatus Lokiarchaeum sp. B-35]